MIRLALVVWVAGASGCALIDGLNGGGGDDQAIQGVSVPFAPEHVAAGHFDDDDILDLAVAAGTTNTVAVLFGNGDGTFSEGFEFLNTMAGGLLAVADLDDNGLDDVIVSTGGGIGIALTQSGRVFEVGSVPALPVNNATVLAAGNLDGVGLPDVVALVPGVGELRVFTQGASFGLTELTPAPSAVDGARALAIGDADGDGVDDIAVAFSAQMQGVVIRRGGALSEVYGQFFSGAAINALALRDMDGDQFGDVAYNGECGGQCAHLGVAYSGPGGSFFNTDSQFGPNGVRELAIGDLDGRDLLDVFGTGFPAPPDLVTFSIESRGLAGPEETHNLGGQPRGIAVGDFDRDDDDDAAVGIFNTNEVVIVLSGEN